jgi:glycosyltransferase involved in cell wall biosynthesis
VAIADPAGPILKPPLVSVVMPCFNDDPEHVRQAVASVLDQTLDALELVIVNDGSTREATLELLAAIQDPPRIRLLSQENLGPAAARNFAITHSRGKYILPLDSDDLVTSDYLRQAADILEAREDIGIVYGDGEYIGHRSGRMELAEFDIRRRDWEQVGGYNESLREGLEDYDLWIKIASKGRGVFKLPLLVYRYRIRPGSRNELVHANRDALVRTQATIFQGNVDIFAKNVDLLYQELENRRVQLAYWQDRYGGLERLLKATTVLDGVRMVAQRCVRRVRDLRRSRRAQS